MKMKLSVLLGVCVLLLAAAGCQTVPSDIPEDLTPMEYFQRGQESVERNNLRGGLVYYETFLERYPDDHENAVVAEYWVANLHRKMGEDETARQLFNELLEKEDELRGRVPDWPFVLSRQVMTEMDDGSVE